MYDRQLKELEFISQTVGNCPDLVQGGGGNTSVKLNDNLMAVKASGFKLSQVTRSEGFVAIDYKNIQNYYHSVDLHSGADFEKDSVEFVKNNIVELEGVKKLRPSVEAGFHSILKKYVIHTHPVYANILCCAVNGRELVDRLFSGLGYSWLWIPYINPGFSLTLKISEGIDNSIKEKGDFPSVIFMENHGLVVTSDDCKKCIELHAEVNRIIKGFLGISCDYPVIELEKKDEDVFVSRTEFLTEFFRNNKVDREFFDRVALYPDQLVYLNCNIAVDSMDNKLYINTMNGELVYNTNYQEALAIEETLVGYLYVVSKINESGLSIKTMSEEDTSFINNWESEKYRKSLLKQQK